MNRIAAHIISLVGAVLLGYGIAVSASLAVSGILLIGAAATLNIYLTRERNHDIIAIVQTFYDTTVRGLDSILDLGVTGMVGYDSGVDYGSVVLEQLLRILGIKHKVQRISTEKIVEKLVEGRMGNITVYDAALPNCVLPDGTEAPLELVVRKQVMEEFCTAMSVVNTMLFMQTVGDVSPAESTCEE